MLLILTISCFFWVFQGIRTISTNIDKCHISFYLGQSRLRKQFDCSQQCDDCMWGAKGTDLWRGTSKLLTWRLSVLIFRRILKIDWHKIVSSCFCRYFSPLSHRMLSSGNKPLPRWTFRRCVVMFEASLLMVGFNWLRSCKTLEVVLQINRRSFLTFWVPRTPNFSQFHDLIQIEDNRG